MAAILTFAAGALPGILASAAVAGISYAIQAPLAPNPYPRPGSGAAVTDEPIAGNGAE
jgi:hypothetical protein